MKTFKQFLLERHIVKDPGTDNPDLYKHPERYIDKEILPTVLTLWKNNIQTWESGGDQDITDEIADSDFNTPQKYMKDAIKQGYAGRAYIWKNRLREKAFIIIGKKDLTKAKQLLPKNIEIEAGTGGFMPSEYNSKAPDHIDLVYIQWRMGI